MGWGEDRCHVVLSRDLVLSYFVGRSQARLTGQSLEYALLESEVFNGNMARR